MFFLASDLPPREIIRGAVQGEQASLLGKSQLGSTPLRTGAGEAAFAFAVGSQPESLVKSRISCGFQ